MKRERILFNKPFVAETEALAAYEAVKSLKIVGNGPVGQEAEKILEKKFGVMHALLTTSCTHALELALLAASVKAHDEVICPSFTFVSTANAIVRQKAVPVFAEIDENTLNIDVDDVVKRITAKTKAIIPVHYAGVSCDMSGIMKAAKRRNITVIEDAAHGIGAKYKDKYLGTIGDMGCFSFHATKNITCGEGGALLLSGDRYYKNAEIAREKGTNRAAYLKGEIDKYSWIREGSSYVLSDVSAAVLIEQLKKADEITKKRRNVFYHYFNGLKALERAGKVFLPHIPEGCEINGHIFYFRVQKERDRDRCIYALKQRGIDATFHFVPLHTSSYGKKALGYRAGDFPVTERASKTLVRLPIYPQLSKKSTDFIIDSVKEVLG